MTAQERDNAEQLALRADCSLEAAALAIEALSAAKKLHGFSWETEGNVLGNPPALLHKRGAAIRKAAAYIRRLAIRLGRRERPEPSIPDYDSLYERLKRTGGRAIRTGGESGTAAAYRMLKSAQDASWRAARASGDTADAGALRPSEVQLELARRALAEIRAAHAAVAAGVAALEAAATVREYDLPAK